VEYNRPGQYVQITHPAYLNRRSKGFSIKIKKIKKNNKKKEQGVEN
jgi:hypothetical protein